MSKSLTCFTTYVSGTSGYNIWSNGYCEQWGRLGKAAAGQRTVTLPKKMANTNYLVIMSMSDNYTGDWTSNMSAFPSSVSAIIINSRTAQSSCHWKVCGYLAADQY